jgi:hypothetical protein
MPEKKPPLNALTFLGFYVNSAMADGHGSDISFAEIYSNLERGTLLEYLEREIPGEFDFSLFPQGSEQSFALNHVLHQASFGFQDREGRKAGIESSGLHILMACILEAIQRRYWELENPS